MSVQPYRLVLDRPGIRSLLLVTLLARIPITAAPVALTLHVVLDLHLGFARSGVLAAMFALGAAFGAPALGKAIDRHGLQPVLMLTTVAEGVFWLGAGYLSYTALLPAALLSGMLALPVFTVARQSLAALLPPPRRVAGFALDSMASEISFAVGPAAGVVAITQLGSQTTFLILSALIVASGLALMQLDPPVRGEEGVDPQFGASRPLRRQFALNRDRRRSDDRSGDRSSDATPARRSKTPSVPVRSWMSARVLAVLLATFGATMTLAGTETAFTAATRQFDEVGLLGVVVAVWCLASLIGGFVYGLGSRRVDPLILLAAMAALTVPLALAGNWWLLAVIAIPGGLFCAPLISSTAELLTSITPPPVRGQVMGAHASALTVGNALGAPLVGVVVDSQSPGAGFLAIGALGLALALLGLGAQVVRRHTVRASDATGAKAVAMVSTTS